MPHLKKNSPAARTPLKAPGKQPAKGKQQRKQIKESEYGEEDEYDEEEDSQEEQVMLKGGKKPAAKKKKQKRPPKEEVDQDDDECWARVAEIWEKHQLNKEDGLRLTQALPYVQEYMQQKGIDVSTSNNDEVQKIFDEIDEDGNGTIER